MATITVINDPKCWLFHRQVKMYFCNILISQVGWVCLTQLSKSESGLKWLWSLLGKVGVFSGVWTNDLAFLNWTHKRWTVSTAQSCSLMHTQFDTIKVNSLYFGCGYWVEHITLQSAAWLVENSFQSCVKINRMKVKLGIYNLVEMTSDHRKSWL